jgi:hypothetical protein
VEVAEASDDAGAVAWAGTWTLTLIVLALIGIAVGDELAIAHPGDDATLCFTILTFGGRRCSCSPRSYSWGGRSDTFPARARSGLPRSRFSQWSPPR